MSQQDPKPAAFFQDEERNWSMARLLSFLFAGAGLTFLTLGFYAEDPAKTSLAHSTGIQLVLLSVGIKSVSKFQEDQGNRQ